MALTKRDIYNVMRSLEKGRRAFRCSIERIKKHGWAGTDEELKEWVEMNNPHDNPVIMALDRQNSGNPDR